MNIYSCPSCSNKFQSDTFGVVKCPTCGAEVRIDEPPMDGTPWDREEGGLLSAYVQTVKLSFTEPMAFFEGVGRRSGIASPLWFALINSFAVALLVAAYQLGFQIFFAGAGVAVNMKETFSSLQALSAPLAMLVVTLGIVFFVPVVTAVGLFIASAVYHLCLMIVGAAHRPFEQTFRVACYSTAPQLLQILPIAGGMIAGIWQLVLSIIGLKIVHRTTYGRATLAIFLPLILCCGVVFIVAAAVAGGAIAAIVAAIPK